MKLALTLVILAAFVGGCVQLPSAQLDPAAIQLDALDLLVADHDHLDPLAHQAARGLTPLAYDALRDEPSTFGELDVVGDLAAVAVLQPTGGFVTIDVSDPAAPERLGWYEAGTAYGADVKIAPDGAHAFLALNSLYAHGMLLEDPTLAPTAGRSAGVHVVSLADPAAPSFESFYPLPTGGVHMLDVHVIDGELYVFSIWSSGGIPVVPSLLPVPMPRPTAYVDIARLDQLPSGAHVLTPVSRYAAPEAGSPIMTGQHDVTVVDDPELGTLLLCACGRAGVSVADVNDPAAPQHLGTWQGHDGLYVHTVMMTYVEGQRVLVAIPETFSAERQQPLWVIDASDPAAMTTIGTWQLPGDALPYDSGYRFSTHNINILDNKVYLAHFHAGVWVLDISTPELLAQPAVVAYGSTAREDAIIGPSLGIAAAPLVWDVVPANGHLLVTDIASGLHVLQPEFALPDELPYGARGAK